MRIVTEQDFRMPEFRDAKVEDYEIRGDGKVVRKDRWETGLRSIAYIVDLPMHGDVEIADVVEKVEKLMSIAAMPESTGDMVEVPEVQS